MKGWILASHPPSLYILSKAEIAALGHESGTKGAFGGSVAACKVTVVGNDDRSKKVKVSME